MPPAAPSFTAASGLPADRLSASILSFARFFSLPFKPDTLAAIRRQSLPPQTLVPDGQGTKSSEQISRRSEAFALAAAAAESKGAGLNPKGLEGFAAAIDPEQRRGDSEKQGRRGKKGKDRAEENAPGRLAPAAGPLTADGLKEMALESMGESPLLETLNRMPGRDGRRWVVLPLRFCEGGREFRASLRALVENDGQARLMALDIAESGRNWLFALSSPGRLAAYIPPELAGKGSAAFAGEMSRLLGIPLEHISVKNYPDLIGTFPAEESYGGDLLRTINEVV